MKKYLFLSYLLIFYIFISIGSYSKESVVEQQKDLEILIKQIEEIKQENKELKDELKNELKKYEEEFKEKLDETKDITSDNLKFYEGTVEFIKWVMERIGAGIVVLLGINIYRINTSKKEIDDRIENFRDETIEKAKDILNIKVEQEKENISRTIEEKIKNVNSTLDNKIENIYNENNQSLLFIEINTILNTNLSSQEKLKSLYSLLGYDKYKNNQYIIKYNLANIYQKEREYDKALEIYKEILKENPNIQHLFYSRISYI